MSKTILALLAALAILLLCACGAAQPSPTPAQTFEASAAPTSTPAATPSPMPLAEDLVRVAELIPGVCTDAKYASTDNFTGSVIYGSDEIYLRRGTAQKLAQVQSELAQEGLYLCIWDGWRPVAAQFALWRACPDPRYVADPFSGFSNHCRGNTVDLTLVTAEGEPVEMPSGFDDFSALADRDYSDVSETAAGNARLLEAAMTEAGFTGYYAEWWHYTDVDGYPVCESLGPQQSACTVCTSALLSAPEDGARELAEIPIGAELVLLDSLGGFALVRCGESYGYLPAGCISEG